MLRIAEEALTFDDVLLVPAHSSVLPKDVSLATHLTREIQLNIPLVSAAMDTVTEARLAITLAQEGGVGIIHKNLDIETQCREVHKVKRSESGVILDPVTIGPEAPVARVKEIIEPDRQAGAEVVEGDDLVHSDGKTAAKSCELLAAHKDEPFWLGVGFVRPHVPFVAPKSYFTPFLPYDKMVLPEKLERVLDRLRRVR